MRDPPPVVALVGGGLLRGRGGVSVYDGERDTPAGTGLVEHYLCH